MEKKDKKTWINSDGDTKMTVCMILFILLHERNHQAHVASTNSWKVEETWTQENHWARTRHNEEIDKMIRDELKVDYTINFVYISSIETFFNRKNQDQIRLESAYWEKKEDNGHDKRVLRFFFVWFERKRRVPKVDAGAENSTPLVFILKPEVVPRERCDARRETLCLMPLDADAELAHHGYVSLFSSV